MTILDVKQTCFKSKNSSCKGALKNIDELIIMPVLSEEKICIPLQELSLPDDALVCEVIRCYKTAKFQALIASEIPQ